MLVRSPRRPHRRGQVIILIAASLTVIMGILAISLDGGMLHDNRRRLQAAADAAALSGGAELFRYYPLIIHPTNPQNDPYGAAAAAATAAATAHGYTSGNGSSTVAVHVPPATGAFAGKKGYIEVVITYNQPRYFSSVWGTQKLPVTARAVSAGRWAGSGNGIICLDPIRQNSLDASGNGSVRVTGNANVVVNSSDPASAARATGGGGVTAAAFMITGGVSGQFNGPVTTGSPPIPDPLRYLPPPPMPPNGTMITESLGNGNKKYTLSPGRYVNLPLFNVGDQVVLKQASAGGGGIYYIDGGGFKSTGATITMDPTTSGGVMIYNAPSGTQASQGIEITGNSAGSVYLSGLTSGPYAGILFFQDRTSPVAMSVSGSGSFNLIGTFYCANALLQVSGQGDATIGSQYISRTLSLSGGGNVKIDYSDEGTARVREVRLVE